MARPPDDVRPRACGGREHPYRTNWGKKTRNAAVNMNFRADHEKVKVPPENLISFLRFSLIWDLFCAHALMSSTRQQNVWRPFVRVIGLS
eukprot:jgi/Bigna1/63906/fgenesh1_kg.62_\